MARELTSYLAEFASEWEIPAKFAATPISPGGSTPTLAPPTVPSVAREADLAVRSGALPAELPPGSTAARPIIPTAPRLHVATVEGWRAEMRAAASRLARLKIEIASRKTGSVERMAEERFARGDVHLQPNYAVREYPAPRDGSCSMAQLVWVDLWFEAQAVLRQFAAMPPRGTPGADVLLWTRNIHDARRALFETLNLRAPFFGLRATNPPNRTLGIVYDQGLATNAQAGGSYTAPTRPSTSTVLTAMDFAPAPRGGYAELVGSNLRQRAIAWGNYGSVRNSGGRYIQTDILGEFVEAEPDANLVSLLLAHDGWAAREVEWLWAKREADSPYRGHRVYHLSEGSRRFYLVVPQGDEAPPATREPDPRWRVYSITTDIAAWIRNAYDYAAYFGNPALSAGEVLLRTTGFYLNSYLDYAARAGLAPRTDVDAGRAQGEAIRARAQAELRTAAYTAAGLVSAVLSAVPVVGAILGAILSGVTALLIELGGAATGGAFISPVLPLYERMFSGTCRDTGWITRPPSEVAPSVPTATAPPPVIAPDGGSVDSEGAKGAGGIIFGVGALWLAYQLFKR